MQAIRMIKHVASVSVVVTAIHDYVNREAIRLDLSQKLIDVLKPPKVTR